MLPDRGYFTPKLACAKNEGVRLGLLMSGGWCGLWRIQKDFPRERGVCEGRYEKNKRWERLHIH